MTDDSKSGVRKIRISAVGGGGPTEVVLNFACSSQMLFDGGAVHLAAGQDGGCDQRPEEVGCQQAQGMPDLAELE